MRVPWNQIANAADATNDDSPTKKNTLFLGPTYHLYYIHNTFHAQQHPKSPRTSHHPAVCVNGCGL
jgi:hypothetical protein